MGIYIFGMLTTLMIEVITLSYSSKVKFDFLQYSCIYFVNDYLHTD